MSEIQKTIRAAARTLTPLSGSDAQALEGALQQAERDLELAKKRIIELEKELIESSLKITKMVQADPRQLWNLAAMELKKENDELKKKLDLEIRRSNLLRETEGMALAELQDIKSEKDNEHSSSTDVCPDCKMPWEDHDFGVPTPYCP